MHRTQIMLEDDQYQALREHARRAGRSMGDLIREMLTAGLSGPASSRKTRRLAAVRGLFHQPGVRGRDHDRYLYGRGD
jgi:plasmid stability protein